MCGNDSDRLRGYAETSVDSVDREGFSSFFMECFQKYERMYEQKYERQ